MTDQERRQTSRMNLAVPVRVGGHDTSGTAWEEMASVKDASPNGVAISLRHAVTRGQVLLLTMPLPKRLRRYDEAEQSYRIFGLVRSVGPDGAMTRVGVMFLGRHPPRDYERTPGGLFLLPSDPPPRAPEPTERRRSSRLDVFVNLRLRRLDGGDGPREEQTIAENIGKGGARVLTSMTMSRGDVVEVEEVGGPFRARAEVCNAYVGDDRIPRLNLCFLDAEAPPRLYQHS